MLALARSRGIDACFARAEDLPYCDELFDTVVATDVLEHVQDLYGVVEEMYRVLKVGGHLIVRVPYCENLQGYVANEYPYEYAHLRNFDEYSLQLQLCRPRHARTLIEYVLVKVHLSMASKLRAPIPDGSTSLTRTVSKILKLAPAGKLIFSLALYLCKGAHTDMNMVVRKTASPEDE